MHDLLQALFALLAALTTATTGAPQASPAVVSNPPALVQPARIEIKGTEAEIRGTIQTINGNTIVVAGQTITLGPNAQVQGKLQVGAFVKIEGTVQADGTVIAREIKSDVNPQQKVEIENNEAEIRGTIDSINGNTIVVAGHTIMLPTSVNIASQLKVGAFVKVEGMLQSDGTILAREIQGAGIKIEEEKEQEHKAEVEEHHDNGGQQVNSGNQGDDHGDGDHKDGDDKGGEHKGKK